MSQPDIRASVVDVDEEPNDREVTEVRNETDDVDSADSPDTEATIIPTPTTAGDWRREAVVYQIYPRSFADSNGDGIGDLAGITSRLEAVAQVGVDAIWLSPFYRSPQADAGYDVSDYRDVDPIFGDLADFDELLSTAHDLGLKVIVDLVPNHSSDEHVWFQEALAAAPGSAARNRYHFVDGKGPDGDLPPNNWPSVFGGNAWTRTVSADGTPGQWYLHLFDSRQPDFNWDNPEVRAEFISVLRFWLDRGVDGFRVDVANSLIKAPGLPDMVPDESGALAADKPHTDADEIPTAAHTSSDGPRSPFWDRDEVHQIYQEWRKVLDSYDTPRLLVAEAWVQPPSRLARYVRPDEMHQAFNFDYLQTPWDAAALRKVIGQTQEANASVGAPTTWVLSNHDVVRHPTRFGLADQGSRPNGIGADDPQPDAELGLTRARAATLLMLALPGSAYIFQGEELGLPEHTTMADTARQDPTFFRSHGEHLGRDGCRVPLPWEAELPGYGFGPAGEPWLPQPESFAALARDLQAGDPDSTLEMYRNALRLRREYNLGGGSVTWLDTGSEDVLAFGNADVTVVANMGESPFALPAGAVVLASGRVGLDEMIPANSTVWLV